ncbi:MAG: prephenate dehydrogenase/arogenate dehydrogenase family protein [Oscillospiraceae bacterium]|nr:prephenate dehydrogenase/arogenate dehydrogenase family protein [Oscillospiraceae bacterium]
MFTIAIIGIGLIGGSLAYALRGFRDCVLVGYDIQPAVTLQAKMYGAIDIAAGSAEQAAEQADLCLFCANPTAILDGIANCRVFYRKGAVVSEICGVKEELARTIPSLLPEGVRYIGLHPMAGKEVGGFVNAERGLFKGAGFILVPPENHDPNALALMRELSEYVGAGQVIVNTPAEHDDIIAYSSDLPHVTATALVSRYPQALTLAHTAGAFRDGTRVANIDADLWTDLFSRNRKPLLYHLDGYIDTLYALRDALSRNDKEAIRGFLNSAQRNKRRIQDL